MSGPDIAALTELRRELHRKPEVSGEELVTAARIVAELERIGPDRIMTGLGGHGVAAVFESGNEGPGVLFRCELDGLPIYDTSNAAWKSQVEGKGHQCGHDGHMVIMCGLAARLAAQRPQRGRVILLFQPAEETGAGAAAVIVDPQFGEIRPDYAFALHNLPGLPEKAVGIRHGPFTFASEGLAIRMEGRTSHAAQPEEGLSPAAALSRLMTQMPQLTERLGLTSEQALVTLSHARLGEAAFGISPGVAEIFLTIRAIDNETQAKLMRAAEALAMQRAGEAGLEVSFSYHENFAAGHNDPEAVAMILEAADTLGHEVLMAQKPYRWSEDFGRFGSVSKTALFVLGAGEDHLRLHNPDYDFPDELIAPGIAMFDRIARGLCG